MEELGLKFFLDAQSKSIKDAGNIKILELKEGKPVAAIFLGDSKNAYEICQLIEKKVDVSKVKGKILETDFDIKSLLK